YPPHNSYQKRRGGDRRVSFRIACDWILKYIGNRWIQFRFHFANREKSWRESHFPRIRKRKRLRSAHRHEGISARKLRIPLHDRWRRLQHAFISKEHDFHR